MSSPSFALSLSGGGLSAIAYAGFHDVLEEYELHPKYYAGLSGGAILSVLLASGLTTDGIKEFIHGLPVLKLLNHHFSHLEIVDHHAFVNCLRTALPIKKFEDLPIPTIIFATDLEKKQPIAISTGDIASAVVASCSIFPLMQPVKRSGLILGDGGFSVYYGAQFLRDLDVKKVVGVDVTGLSEGRMKGFLSALFRQINSSVTSNARYELERYPVDLNIPISFPSPTVLTYTRQEDHLIRLGHRTAKHYLPHLQQVLHSS